MCMQPGCHSEGDEGPKTMGPDTDFSGAGSLPRPLTQLSFSFHMIFYEKNNCEMTLSTFYRAEG